MTHTPEELEKAVTLVREMQVRYHAQRHLRRKNPEREAQRAAERKTEQEQRKAAREAKQKKTRYVRKPDMPGRQKQAGRPQLYSHPDPLLCTKCGVEPRAPRQRWCKKCRAAYMRGYDRIQDAP